MPDRSDQTAWGEQRNKKIIALVGMITTGEDELVCDLWETYQIRNWRELPVRTVAVLSFGLPDNSRIKRKMAGMKVPLETLLSAVIADRLGILVWMQTKDAQKKRNMPKSLTEELMKTEKKEDDFKVFESGDDFMKAWEKIAKGE